VWLWSLEEALRLTMSIKELLFKSGNKEQVKETMEKWR